MSSSNHIDLNGLSISNSGATNNNHSNRVRASTAPSTPSLTSFTPPPPGFDAPAATTTNNNNSAAQTTAIEQSPHRKSPSFTNLAMALGTGLAECMDNSTSDNTTTNNMSSMAVDNYARQSRHAVTRLIGHSQFQQQQREGRGSVPPSLTMGGQQSQTQSQLGSGGVYGVGNVGGVNNGVKNGGSGVNNTNGGGQVRFTAAMMAQHHQTSHHPNTNNANVVSGDQLVLSGQFNRNNGDSSTAATPSGAASNHHGTNNGGMGYNPLTKQQGLQFSQHPSSSQQQPLPQPTTTSTNVMMRTNPNITVVEPNSARNSPAILPNNTSTILQSTNHLQQQPQQQLPITLMGGRASAPPSNLTTGTGRTASVLHSTAVHPNLRAYTANSLQMRVAELHQELGGGVSNTNGNNSGRNGENVNGKNVGVVGQPTPPSSRPTTPGQPQPQQVQQQQMRTIIVTSATPPLHPNTTPRPTQVVMTPPPPSSGHVVASAASPSPSGNIGMVTTAGSGSNSRSTTPMVITPEQRERELIAAKELAPFLKRGTATDTSDGTSNNSSSSSNNTSSSRGLAILHASKLNIPDIRSTCEAFGALESFRSDFMESRGVVFATFYDLRSAQMAVVELPNALNKMVHVVTSNGSGGGMMKVNVAVEYCVPLNASSATDESMLFLSNLPGTVDELDLSRVLSSFGEVRAVHYQANMSGSSGGEEEEEEDLASYMVEFFDVQDARQALMELEQAHSWGERASVKVATRSPAKRKQGKELIMLMSNWRQGVAPPSSSTASASLKAQSTVEGNTTSGAAAAVVSNSRTPSPPSPSPKYSPTPPSAAVTADTTPQASVGHTHSHHMAAPGTAAHPYYPYGGDLQQQYAAQLVMGPDGHYQYVLVNHAGHYGHPGQMVIDPHQQQQLMYGAVDPQYMHMNPQQYHHIQYANTANYSMPLGHDIHHLQQQQAQQHQQPPTQFIRMPSNTTRGGEGNSSSLSSDSQPGANRSKSNSRTLSGKSGASVGSGSGGSSGNNSGGNGEEHNELALFIENVKNGKDVRSSLMVRNIPNKYTQQMLLGEFAAAGYGPDKMDFFYLPIDFKNKCNRGYAFVNFVDYKDIVPFYDEYNGTSWKRFNSDKICDITYARIQGKAAMLKRFENSALMAKDDEYRPMVFVSHGERKGQRESFG